MRSGEILQEIEKGREDGLTFIRWWRKENDFSDYELCDRFVKNSDSFHEIGGFDLLNLEQMWEVLKRWTPSGLRRIRTARGEQIEWHRKLPDGRVEVETCALTPEAVMYIFDYETGGDVLC